MPNYLITYDAPDGANYQPFYDAIAKCNAAHLSQSVWLISTSLNAAEVRNWVKSLFGNTASVAVVEISSDWATYGVAQDASSWLEVHLG